MGARDDLERLLQQLAQLVDAEDDPSSKRTEREVLKNAASLQSGMDQLVRLLAGSHPEQEPADAIISKAPEPDTRNESNEHSTEREALLLEEKIDPEEPAHANAAQEGTAAPIDEDQCRDLRQRPSRFPRLQWVVAASAIGIALLIPGSGGSLLSVHPSRDTAVQATAAIPPLVIAPTPGPGGNESAGNPPVSTGLISPAAGSGDLGEPVAQDATPKKGTSAVAGPPPETQATGAVLTAAAAPSSNAGTQKVEDHSNGATAELLDRGDARLGKADLAGARLLYERAATEGNAQAALRLGQTYDPAFLAEGWFRAIRGDPSIAASWYMRADKLGAPEAEALLRALAADVGLSAPQPNNRPPAPTNK